MRLRGPLVSTGALGLAVLAVATAAVWASVNHVRAIDADTIRIPGTEIMFAPAPGAAPAMTARQAWARFSDRGRHHAMAAGTAVQLGLLTVPIGPYCGAGCDGHPVRDGIAYTALDQLAYGYSWLAFPHRHLKARNWIFLDANTGKMIVGTLSREPGSRAAPAVLARGVVTGLAAPCAGPPMAATAPVRVFAIRNGRTVATQVTQYKVRHDRYRFVLAPGRYAISAPRSADSPQVVLVHSGQTVTVNFPDTCY